MNQAITIKVIKLESLLLKTLGLIVLDGKVPVFMNTRYGIHTFFLKYPINIYILNENNRVVAVKMNLQPWRVWFWNPRYYKVIESRINIKSVKKMKLGAVVKII
jgi:uncharacterized membrane protein (UPF0127 family)